MARRGGRLSGAVEGPKCRSLTSIFASTTYFVRGPGESYSVVIV
jgi:hypothetical protein